MHRFDALNCTPAWLATIGLIAAILLVDVPDLGISTATAQQNVTVTPTRVVFDERDRTKELVLLNRGNEEVTYRASLIGMKMTDEGSLERIDEPEDDQQFAHDLLRFAPRQVHLEPGESQRIRVSVRKPEDLEEGEYRSHMLFQAVPEARDDDGEDADGDQLALQLNIISGLSIPAIVRHGELSADVSMQDLEFVEQDDDATPDRVRMRLNRDGDRSVYGDIDVEFIPDQQTADDESDEAPEPVMLARRGGTAVYTPNDWRDLEIPIQQPEDYSLDEGRIVVTYESDETGETLTSGEIEFD